MGTNYKIILLIHSKRRKSGSGAHAPLCRYRVYTESNPA
jgi:hypothetical protein